MIYLPVAVPRKANGDSKPRSQARHNASQFGCTMCVMVAKCAFRQRGEFAAFRVGFELAVPDLGIVMRKPLTESPQFRSVQLRDLPFQLFDAAHLNYSSAASTAIPEGC